MTLNIFTKITPEKGFASLQKETPRYFFRIKDVKLSFNGLITHSTGVWRISTALVWAVQYVVTLRGEQANVLDVG